MENRENKTYHTEETKGYPGNADEVIAMTSSDDYGKSVFREIGKLSSQLPAYVRHCCRSMHDGTDDEVLDAFRVVSYKVLSRHIGDYPFVEKHAELMRYFDPDMVKKIICANHTGKMESCLSINSSVGLPKRACLHCPKVGLWMKEMEKAGKIDEKTGKRVRYE